MKILNFTVPEILPALLSKAKTQTIRPAWKEKPYMVNILAGVKNPPKEIFPKPARFKVGDSIKLLWNQRSKYHYFCRICGTDFDNSKSYGDYGTCKCGTRIEGIYIANHTLAGTIQHSVCFNKLLGTGTITDVFKIEMSKGIFPKIGNGFIHNFINYIKNLEYWIKSPNKDNCDKLAKLDGFSSAEEFFSYFDEHYNLSQPKNFWVYRFRWD